MGHKVGWAKKDKENSIRYRTFEINDVNMRIRSDVPSKYVNDKDYEIAKVANALSHPVRVALVRYLSDKNKGKGVDNVTCNKDLVNMFDYSQSTISQHVKVLKEAGLFLAESKDKFTFYYLNIDLLHQFAKSLRL